jgi:hypothetical protein
MSLNESGWLEISFICYDCASWTPKSPDSAVQPWIWSYNSVQHMSKLSEDSRLAAHEYWGWFDLDMAEAQGTRNSSILPVIDPTIPNQVIEGQYATPKASHGWSSLHGVSLAVAMMLLYPCGAVAIRGGPATAFRNHVLFQVPASISCFVGAATAIYAGATSNTVSSRPSDLQDVDTCCKITSDLFIGELFGTSRPRWIVSSASGLTPSHTRVCPSQGFQSLKEDNLDCKVP